MAGLVWGGLTGLTARVGLGRFDRFDGGGGLGRFDICRRAGGGLTFAGGLGRFDGGVGLGWFDGSLVSRLSAETVQ